MCPSNEKSVANPEFPRMVSCFKIVQKRITSNFLSTFFDVTLHLCRKILCTDFIKRTTQCIIITFYHRPMKLLEGNVSSHFFQRRRPHMITANDPLAFTKQVNPFPNPGPTPWLNIQGPPLPTPGHDQTCALCCMDCRQAGGCHSWSTFLFYYSRQRNNTRLCTARSEAAVITVSSTATRTTVSGWSPKRWTPYSNNPTASSTSTTSDQRKSKESSMRLILGELR